MKSTISTIAGLAAICVSTVISAQSGPTSVAMLTPLAVTADSRPFGAAVGLAAKHYVEDEYVVTGAANVYEYDADQQLRIKTPDLPYAARLLVRRPEDPQRFNGTIVFELLNTTLGFDTDMMWLYTRDQLMDDGYIYVGLSNTAEGNGFSRSWNAVRYANLGVMTFGQTWDMAAQVAVLLKDRSNTSNPLAGYDIRQVLAAGHSASARFWRTYGMVSQERALLPDGRPAVDGYLLSGHRVPPATLSSGEPPYTDDRRLVLLNVPVIRLQTETEVSPAPFAPTPSVAVVRQPDTAFFRMYEVAGTSHFDQEIAELAFGPGAALIRDVPTFAAPSCVLPTNPLGYAPYVRMALHRLTRWAADGVSPPMGQRIEYTPDPPPVGGSVRDGFGNAIGGIRPPQMDVPTGQHLPYNPPAVAHPTVAFFCGLTGAYVAFDDATLAGLYGNHGNYVSQFVRAVDRVMKDGYLLKADGKALKDQATKKSHKIQSPR